MNDTESDEAVGGAESCVACRWLALLPQPYGSIEYFCRCRQEPVPSAGVGKRRCPDFARDAR